MESLRAVAGRSVLFGFVVITTCVFLWMLSGFFMPIFFAVVLAILFSPLYRRITSVIPRYPGTASATTVIIALALVAVPMYAIGSVLTSEAIDLYRGVSENPDRVFAELMTALPDGSLGSLGISSRDTQDNLMNALKTLSAGVFDIATAATTSTIAVMVKSVIALYLMFFFLKDGERFLAVVQRYFPLPDAQERALFARFASTVRAVVKGGLIVAAAQGFLGGVLFLLVGVPHPALWGFVMGFLALLPLGGPALVWVPAAIMLAVSGSMLAALFLAVGGAFLVGTIDNILRPALVGRDTAIPDVLILLSVFGGIASFGPGGIIIGPVVTALFLSVWHMFAGEVVHSE